MRRVAAAVGPARHLPRRTDIRRARLVLKNAEVPEVNLIEPIYKLAAEILHDSIRAFSEHDLETSRKIDD